MLSLGLELIKHSHFNCFIYEFELCVPVYTMALFTSFSSL